MNIGVIGLGLIGGSLARAFKKAGNTVFGYDISQQTMLKAELLEAYTKPLDKDNYNQLDLLIIAVYPRSFDNILQEVAPKLKDGAIILDIAGTKRVIVEAMKKASQQYPNLKFVATHPMAGKEFWGINHSSSSLFEKASLLVAPVKADIADLVKIKKAFVKIGVASVVMTNAELHDKRIAYTSQLAHLISSSYVKSPSALDHDGYSAGSFRDLTRVAKLNADMWSQLIFDNRDNVIKELDIFIDNITRFRNALCNNDEQQLNILLAEGNEQKVNVEKATREWKRIHNEND
ncbi:MAG TPA: prephenate dehydrogenase [Clostridia bacterium]|nr:prephenate dehydrogenase [Clostridia bacterium]